MLLWVYAVLPLVLVFVLVDHFVFAGTAMRVLPHFPEKLFWYMLIFNLPHIIASFFGFADKEYLAYYRSKLFFGLPIIFLLAFVLPWLNLSLTIIFIIGYTFYHNVSQQTGIATILMRHRGPAVTAWRATNIILAVTIYGLVYPSALNPALYNYATQFIFILLAVSLILTFVITRKSKTKEGTIYALGTTGIACVGMIALMLGYPIITITILRFVHDLTAFIFYITHDMNRNRELKHNLLYRFVLPTTRLYVVGIPLLAVVLTYLIQGKGSATIIQIFFILAVTHYYIEGFMWKNGTPHRREIAFSA